MGRHRSGSNANNTQDAVTTSRVNPFGRHRNERERESETRSSRFESLMEGAAANPFRGPVERSRRPTTQNNERRQPAPEPTPAPEPEQETRRQPSSRSGIRSRDARSGTHPSRPVSVDINETTVFPELIGNTCSINPNANAGHWQRSGLDILNGITHEDTKPNNATDGDHCASDIKPGWARISIHGIEYGPRSDRYEMVRATSLRTNRIIHREMFARSNRIYADNIDNYGDSLHNERSALSDGSSDLDNDNDDGSDYDGIPRKGGDDGDNSDDDEY